jgi:hypothetical protein
LWRLLLWRAGAADSAVVPANAGIQYSRASRTIINALEYWTAGQEPGDDGLVCVVSRTSTTFAHISRRASYRGALHQSISDSTFGLRTAPARWNGLALDTY